MPAFTTKTDIEMTDKLFIESVKQLWCDFVYNITLTNEDYIVRYYADVVEIIHDGNVIHSIPNYLYAITEMNAWIEFEKYIINNSIKY